MPVLEVLGLLGKLAPVRKRGEFASEGPEPVYNESGHYALKKKFGRSSPGKRRDASLEKRGKVKGSDDEVHYCKFPPAPAVH